MKTFVPNAPANEDRPWILVDAAGKPLGRIAVEIANALRGKNRPDFDPAVDMGAFIVVINAEKVVLTGKKEEQKMYSYFSGWRGGQKNYNAATIRERNPTILVKEAVWGMLPKNNTAKIRMTRLKIFAGAEHTHAAQKPVPASF